MLILCDSKIPEAAKTKLATYGEIVEFATHGITYDAISGHPDIFFCPTPAGLIVAPNLPEKFISLLQAHSIQSLSGSMPVGSSYPGTAIYNALVTNNIIIQNTAHSAPEIAILNPEHKILNVKQGYVRCNLLALPNGSFITSDHGIWKALSKLSIKVLFVDSSCIKLQDFNHGFFGGTCGWNGNTLFICGSLSFFEEKQILIDFIEKSGVQIVELYDGQPVDVGTILFLAD